MSKRSVSTRLAYLAPSVESSLYRNGKVFTHRDRDGSDDEYHGAVTREQRVTINNGRLADQSGRKPAVGTHGFELLDQQPVRPGLDFFDHQQVLREYYPECAEIVRQATGAQLVLAFDHNIRWAQGKSSGKRIAGGQQVQGPIHIVHGDYTLTSAPQRLLDLASPPGINDTLRSVLRRGETLLDGDFVSRTLEEGRRYALINVWRSMDQAPVMSDPLALCDGQSVAPEDLVVFEIHYSDRVGENYFAKHAPGHEWWYYPAMTRDELVLIKQWDSAGALARSGGECADAEAGGDAPCTFSFHTAFSDPSTPPDAPERQSIEVRCVVFFD